MVGPVGTQPHVRQNTRGPGLELAVFDYGEADPSDCQGGIIDPDSALDGSRIERIGQVAGLGSFDLFNVFEWSGIATIVAGP